MITLISFAEMGLIIDLCILHATACEDGDAEMVADYERNIKSLIKVCIDMGHSVDLLKMFFEFSRGEEAAKLISLYMPGRPVNPSVSMDMNTWPIFYN